MSVSRSKFTVCVPADTVIAWNFGRKPTARARTATLWPLTRAAGMLIVYVPASFVATERFSSVMYTLAP